MANDKDRSGDDLGRSLAAMLGMSRGIPELFEMWRAVADVLVEQRSSSRGGKANHRQALAADAIALVVDANALLFNNSLQYWLRWQRLVSRRVPAIRRRLEAFKAEDDPSPELRAALMDEIRLYLREMAELPCDQCRRVQHDIEELEKKIFEAAEQRPDAKQSGETTPRRGGRPRGAAEQEPARRRRHRVKR
jgi:hypothetical protein